MTPDLPGGTITFLFTDIEGSTPLWEREPERMRPALAHHNAILRQAVAGHNGQLFKMIGDAIQAAFALPADALNAALAAQRELEAADWPTSVPLRVRMGLHIGPAEPAGADYATTHTLNRAARIMAAAHGGQIVLSAEVAELLHGYLPPDASLRDLGQHRMKGLSQREHLYQLVAPGLPSAFPPLSTLDAIPNNLPVQLSSFVGREREITDIEQLISPPREASLPATPARSSAGQGIRLLTLTGPGGTGKTRLSLQVAAQVLEAFPDGVWLVELAPLADPALLGHALTTVLGVREQPGRELFDVLADYLHAKCVLIILDNCEHLIGACAEAANRLLRAAPGVTVLASSREALGIAGEMTVRVPSLPSPEADGSLSLEALGQYEAVRLFVERAQAALPGFALTQQNMSAVAQVCHRLDGIPLAIELAAVRVKLLRVEQIAARLDDSFRLLTGGSRTALPRQQTLRALIDWSYNLLTEPERALLRRLSVFADGWTLEAAEQVCAGEHEAALVEADILDLLTRLVDKSLVMADRVQGDETRYRLLENIRQYARDKLFDAKGSEGAALQDQHLAYFLALAERAEPRLFGPDESQWLERLEGEHDNLRAALGWALEANAEAALRLAGSLLWFWEQRGHNSEAQAEMTKALGRALALPEPLDEAGRRRRLLARAKVLGGLGDTNLNYGYFVTGCRMLKESTDLLRDLGEKRLLAFGLSGLAVGELIAGNPPAAQAAAEESLATGRALSDPWALASALLYLGQYEAMAHSDLDTARAELEESVRLFRQIGSEWGTANSLLTWGVIANTAGDYATARPFVEECLPIFLERHDSIHLNRARSELAYIERLQAHVAQAVDLYRQTIVAWQEFGHRDAVAYQLDCLAYLARADGQAERAARLLGAGLGLANVWFMQPSQQAEYERELSALRSRLDDAALAHAWAEGQAMTLDEAVAYALGDMPD